MIHVFDYADLSVVDFWKKNGITENDFYCKDCGNLMIDVNELSNVAYHSKNKKGLPLNPPMMKISSRKRKKRYVESEQNRWCIVGRNLSGKVFFRRICWKCFFKKLRETEDIARKARKSEWYAKLLNGEDVIPPTCVSPSPYFKLLFDITDDELNVERAKFDTASLASFIRRHGEVEGRKKYEAYRERQAYTCSKEYMKETRGWSEEDWNKFNESRACTEKNFVARYGEELGKKKWKEYCAYEAYAGNSLTYFVDKYGKEAGTAKYIEVSEKKMFKYKTYSNVSQDLFKQIDKLLGNQAKESRWETKNFEYELYLDIDGIKKIARVDYYLSGKVIEFNGDFWHANPQIYDADDMLPRRDNITEKASDLWQRDAKRKAALEKLGYKVKVVWERDFYNDLQKVIDECVEFLKS